MQAERRRQGRAIRKARRLERESYFAQQDRLREYVMNGGWARDVQLIIEVVQDFYRQLAEAFIQVGKALLAAFGTPRERNRLALTPGAGALRRSEVPPPYPTRSGGRRVTGRSGVSVVGAWIDEPQAWMGDFSETENFPTEIRPDDEQVDFGGWEDH
jgi:hypothetical protein